MKTLARDRRTLRVCACGWGCPVCLLVLCKTCARFLQDLREDFAAETRRKKSEKTLENGSKIDQNGSKRRPGTPSGEGRERGGKKERKRRGPPPSNGYLFGPRNRFFFDFGVRELFGRLAKSSLFAAFLRFAPFPFFGRPGCSLACPRGPLGVPLGPPRTPKTMVLLK